MIAVRPRLSTPCVGGPRRGVLRCSLGSICSVRRSHVLGNHRLPQAYVLSPCDNFVLMRGPAAVVLGDGYPARCEAQVTGKVQE